MTIPGAGFPYSGGPVPGAAPQGLPTAPNQGGGFVLNIPADPNWEPFDTLDVLEMDGYYCARITKEGARTDQSKSRGVFLTLVLEDPDVRGKTLSKFLPDPTAQQKDVWFLWRGLFRAITGDLNAARSAFQYTPGMLTGQLVYFKTKAYVDDGAVRTGVDAWCTKAEWDGATAQKLHRWPVKVSPTSPGGALPTGLPGAFPVSAFPGLQGGPSAPVPTSAPMVAPAGGFPGMALAPAAPAAPAQVMQPPLVQPPQVMQPAAAPAAPAQPAAFPGFAAPAAPPAPAQAAHGFPGFAQPGQGFAAPVAPPQPAQPAQAFPGFPGAAAPQPTNGAPAFPLPGTPGR